MEGVDEGRSPQEAATDAEEAGDEAQDHVEGDGARVPVLVLVGVPSGGHHPASRHQARVPREGLGKAILQGRPQDQEGGNQQQEETEGDAEDVGGGGNQRQGPDDRPGRRRQAEEDAATEVDATLA